MVADAGHFWAFSLAFYRRPAVRDACLHLQDRHAMPVNLLLAACWLAAGRQWLDADGWCRLQAGSADWHAGVLLPLRALRRQPAVVAEPALYQQLLAAELLAERREQALLVQRLAELSPQTADSCGEAARQSLVACWAACGQTLPVPAAVEVLAAQAETAA